MTMIILTNFRSPIPFRLPMEFGIDWPSGIETKMFEGCGRRTDDGAYLYYKLSHDPKSSGELIRETFRQFEKQFEKKFCVTFLMYCCHDYKHGSFGSYLLKDLC